MIEELLIKEKDFLTGCYAKERLMPMLKQIKKESDETGMPFSVLLIDVDHFKTYNDKYGHINGDELLKFFSSSLRLMLTGEKSSIFRIGGDEFIVAFPNKNSKETFSLAVQIARSIRTRPCVIGKHLFKLSFSGGISTYPNDSKELNEILEGADKAMYISKKYGRGGVARLDMVWLAVARKILAIPALILLIAINLYLYVDISGVKGFYRNYYLMSFRSNGPAPSVVKAPKPKPDVPLTPPTLTPPELNTTKAPEQKLDVSFTSSPAAPQSSPETKPSFLPPKRFDMLYLRTGAMVIGDIVYEDDNEVRVNLYTGSEQILIKLKRADIREIDRNVLDKTMIIHVSPDGK